MAKKPAQRRPATRAKKPKTTETVAEEKNRRGRPSGYSEEIADKIIDSLVDGKSIRTICREPGMPSASMVFRWLANPEMAEFRERYARARTAQADAIFDETLDIADDGTNDWMATNDPENPGYKANSEHIQRSRLRIDTRKWIAARLAPSKYGEKAQIEHTGPEGGAIPLSVTMSEERFREIAREIEDEI